jgi:lipopolysaccharide/colanic/teichoic acid biosynthesis glycosyltransferase
MNHAPTPLDTVRAPSIADAPGKRAFDLVMAGVALTLLAPLLLLAALAIKLTSRGPVLFVQPRRGKHGRVFNIVKLRTLEHDRCDPPHSRDVRPVAENDTRVFPVGRFLRERGLDEIPQFWNVIRGEMSVVGPRPHAVSHDDFFLINVPGYAIRYAVKPGITGLAQVSGCRGQIRSLDEIDRRVYFDLDYIDRVSLTVDIGIVCRTIWIVLFGADPKRSQAEEARSHASVIRSLSPSPVITPHELAGRSGETWERAVE